MSAKIDIDLNEMSIGTLKVNDQDIADSVTDFVLRARVGSPPAIEIRHLARFSMHGDNGEIVHTVLVDGYPWIGSTYREALQSLMDSLPDDPEPLVEEPRKFA